MGGRFAANSVGGGVPDAPRRGQDPSLRCKRYMGGNGKVAGRACPAPTDCHNWVVHERGKGGRQPASAQLAGGCPGTGGDAKPVETLQASQARPALRTRTPLSLRDISPRSGESPLKGEPFARAKPAREASLVKGRCRAQARRRDSRPSAGVTCNPASPVEIPQSANAASPL